MAEALAVAGFAGISLDRLGFADDARDVEARLATRLQAALIASANGRLLFFSLLGLSQTLRAQYSAQEWDQKRREVLRPLVVE